MFLFIKDNISLGKYNAIWEKGKDSLKNESDSEPVYKKKYLKAKIKSYNGKTNTKFHNNKIRKEDSQYICLSVILIDFAFRTGKNYYPRVFLEKCEYVIKEKKIDNYIIDDVEVSSDSDENSGEVIQFTCFTLFGFQFIKLLFVIQIK